MHAAHPLPSTLPAPLPSPARPHQFVDSRARLLLPALPRVLPTPPPLSQVDSKGLITATRGDKLPEHKQRYARNDGTPDMKAGRGALGRSVGSRRGAAAGRWCCCCAAAAGSSAVQPGVHGRVGQQVCVPSVPTTMEGLLSDAHVPPCLPLSACLLGFRI